MYLFFNILICFLAILGIIISCLVIFEKVTYTNIIKNNYRIIDNEIANNKICIINLSEIKKENLYEKILGKNDSCDIILINKNK